MFVVKNSMEGREVNMINTQHCVKNRFVKNRVGGRGVNLNLDNVFKYTVCFFDATPKLKYDLVCYGGRDLERD